MSDTDPLRFVDPMRNYCISKTAVHLNSGPLLRMCNGEGRGIFGEGPGEVTVGRSVSLQLPAYICMV
jgi:hypothetical protein